MFCWFLADIVCRMPLMGLENLCHDICRMDLYVKIKIALLIFIQE